jgi:hypothetical protein
MRTSRLVVECVQFLRGLVQNEAAEPGISEARSDACDMGHFQFTYWRPEYFGIWADTHNAYQSIRGYTWK